MNTTGLLCPGPVDFDDVLYPAHGANFQPDVVRDRDYPQFCTMAIGSPTKFLHNLGQFQVISRDQFSALIEARLSGRRGLGANRRQDPFP